MWVIAGVDPIGPCAARMSWINILNAGAAGTGIYAAQGPCIGRST